MAFKMNYTKESFPYKSSFTTDDELMDKAKSKYEQHLREGKVKEIKVDTPTDYDPDAYREDD
jgi:TorA maturation chaperone TorD|tara:strand:+ start:222 stop:407 length:186 start_codon:yes stop_codon:yes gene_type:complete